MSTRGGMKCLPTCGPLLRLPTGTCWSTPKISPCWSLVSLVQARLRTPRRSSPILLWLLLLEKNKLRRCPLRTRLLPPIQSWSLMVMPKHQGMTIPPVLVNSFVSTSLLPANSLVVTLNPTCWKSPVSLSNKKLRDPITFFTNFFSHLSLIWRGNVCSVTTFMITLMSQWAKSV